MLKVTGRGSITTCDGITRRDFLQVGSLGAIGLSMAKYAAMQTMGAVTKGNEEKSVIMIFNLGAPQPIGHLGHEARCSARDPRPIQAYPH